MKASKPLIVVVAASVLAAQMAHSESEASLFGDVEAGPPVAAKAPVVSVMLTLEADSNRLRVVKMSKDQSEGVSAKDLEVIGFWGLDITDPRRLKGFLANRAHRCAMIQRLEGVEQLDCYAAPRSNPALMEYAMTESWISLFHWLPEFGLARRACTEGQETRVVDWETAGRIHYLCIEDRYPARGEILRGFTPLH
ncbi:hypothetical protein TRL7639_02552 [Falsiruegeria litorea R37]|uniref:Uncharacterized protein n=1 Tax=Falsiruegeria litorea R37 TaxID=1200284 RepID=A0A1Y5SRM2_9RHOB|nr:hypothetical protein TRL7639_02552 [Falsiruegeria litorea R37]